ncbi:MAG: hypothetical protein AABY10_03730 [Nanoarchaeota archaeon]
MFGERVNCKRGKLLFLMAILILFVRLGSSFPGWDAFGISDPTTINNTISLLQQENDSSGLIEFLLNDDDLDRVPNSIDFCPNSRFRNVDRYGCDLNQFCSALGCSRDCFRADWKNDSKIRNRGDCTLVLVEKEGKIQQPECAPLICIDDPKNITVPNSSVNAELIFTPSINHSPSNFLVKLDNVPSGFGPINNSVYGGWCVELSKSILSMINYNATLISSLDPDLLTKCPLCAGVQFDKINYIINHKPAGVPASDVQIAIWHFTPLGIDTQDPDALAIIAEAEAFGDGFLPTKGQFVAVVVKINNFTQLIFIEVDP